MRVAVLGSGSGGNCVVVDSEHGRLLLDAGFSCRQILRRLELVGIAPESIDAVVLTHEHHDHVCGVASFGRRFAVPILATAGTVAGLRLRPEVAARVRVMRTGEPVELPGFRIEPFAIPHDAREPVGLVVEDANGCRLGLAGDIGCRSRLAWARLQGVHVLLLEANHDLEMLRNGPYPWPLKQRVSGRHGHLSNADAAEGLPELLHDGLGAVVLYHLSQTNNLPALAATVVAETLDRCRAPVEVVVTHQDRPTAWVEVG